MYPCPSKKILEFSFGWLYSPLDTLCEGEAPTKDLEELLRNFTNNVNATAKLFISRGKRKQNWEPYWKGHDIYSLIKERDLLNKQLKTNNRE
ncbi:hypothetical protein TNCT_43191 [Trichonephila clavata]|uniref:Uncharacterized protein n=1 Tax=Trichonephila clavata TaxID=2740835 RepID=A0A8X6H060_TRICU|nr:hypothetical protein TNCT_43191 [Trichonephila clavata]